MAGTNIIPDGNTEIAAEIPLIVEIVARTRGGFIRKRLEPFPFGARGRRAGGRYMKEPGKTEVRTNAAIRALSMKSLKPISRLAPP